MMNKKVFIARAIGWTLFSCVLPVLFIGWRYSLFKKVGALQLSGWGLIGILIIFIFLRTLVRYIRAGFVGWSMVKQVLNGVIKILLPLGVVLIVAIAIRNNLDYFIQALSIVLILEAIAIPLNPFPQWVWEKSQGRFESLIDLIANKNKKESDK